MSLEKAKEVLNEAVNHDRSCESEKAVKKYLEGIEILMSHHKDLYGTQKDALRTSIEHYMDRVEFLKSNRKLKYALEGRILIEDGSECHDYDTIFGQCLNERLTELVIEDPYIIQHHQILNLSVFCALVVRRCKNLKRLKLITCCSDGNDQALTYLAENLKKRNVFLEVSFVEKNKLHDRQVWFDNGWLIKIGRGLDIFKPPENKYAIEANCFYFRKCKSTGVDIFTFHK